jgi:hypothetical protein
MEKSIVKNVFYKIMNGDRVEMFNIDISITEALQIKNLQ